MGPNACGRQMSFLPSLWQIVLPLNAKLRLQTARNAGKQDRGRPLCSYEIYVEDAGAVETTSNACFPGAKGWSQFQCLWIGATGRTALGLCPGLAAGDQLGAAVWVLIAPRRSISLTATGAALLALM